MQCESVTCNVELVFYSFFLDWTGREQIRKQQLFPGAVTGLCV